MTGNRIWSILTLLAVVKFAVEVKCLENNTKLINPTENDLSLKDEEQKVFKSLPVVYDSDGNSPVMSYASPHNYRGVQPIYRHDQLQSKKRTGGRLQKPKLKRRKNGAVHKRILNMDTPIYPGRF